MYQAFFFRLSQKKNEIKEKRKRLIAGQANLDLSGVANLGTILIVPKLTLKSVD